MTGGARRRRPLVCIAALAASLLVGLAILLVSMGRTREAARVREALGRSRFDEARALLDKWIAAEPDNGEAHYLRAMVAWQRREFADVQPALEDARRAGYDADRIDRLWGLLLQRSGKAEEAEPLLRRAWDSPPDETPDVEVAEALALIAMSRLELGTAIEMLDRWAREAPTDPRPLVWRAEVDRRTGVDRSVTMGHFRQALDRDPGYLPALLGLAELLYLAGRYGEAAELYAKAVHGDPDDARGHIGAGICAWALGDEPRAASELDRGLEADPTSTLALRTKATVCLRQGKLEGALELLTRATRTDPFDPELHYQRSIVLARMDRKEEAESAGNRAERLRREHARMAELNQALVANPHDHRSRIEAARWMMEHGRAEEGAAWARIVLRDHPSDGEANRLMAEYFQARGEIGLANHYRLNAYSSEEQPSGREPERPPDGGRL
jgi:tetratricopeptide (TPR) repeat protein